MNQIQGVVVSEYKAWRVVRDSEGGFWLKNPMGDCSGFAFNETAAKELLDEKSGRAIDSMPVVSRKDIRKVMLPRQHGTRGEWVQFDEFSLNGKALGRIQTRRQYHGRLGHRYDVLTTTPDGRGVQGGSLAWLCTQAGYRLTD